MAEIIFCICSECKDPCWAIIKHANKLPEICLYDEKFTPDFERIEYSDIHNEFKNKINRIELPEGYLNEKRV